MPLYKFRCPRCFAIKDNVFTKSWEENVYCDECKERMTKIPSPFIADVFPNGGIHLEHVSSEGKTFYSKGEMKKYAKENDLELGAL